MDNRARRLASAGCAYALAASDLLHPFSQGDGEFAEWAPEVWPWDQAWWKPSDPRRMLIKAIALCLAEVEKMDRATPPKAPSATEGEAP